MGAKLRGESRAGRCGGGSNGICVFCLRVCEWVCVCVWLDFSLLYVLYSRAFPHYFCCCCLFWLLLLITIFILNFIIRCCCCCCGCLRFSSALMASHSSLHAHTDTHKLSTHTHTDTGTNTDTDTGHTLKHTLSEIPAHTDTRFFAFFSLLFLFVAEIRE